MSAGAVAGVLLGVVVAFASLTQSAQRDSRTSLEQRFQTRATMTAGFARDYLDDYALRERSQAERLLASPTADQDAFEQVVAAFDLEAAVILDDAGRLLHVWPARPELLGRDMTIDYEHLRTAAGGNVGVSNMVPSAAAGMPVTAVAVPFESDAGRRVFSGAFSPANTPLGSYFESVVPVSGGTGFLIDRTGNVIAGKAGAIVGSDLVAVSDGIIQLTVGGVSTTAAIAPVEGTQWRVVLAAPTHGLLAPLAGARSWVPWALLAVLIATSAVTIVLFLRLGRARAHAGALAHTDELTGLPNRRAMNEVLDRAIAHSQRHGEELALLMVDLDHFKSINDTYGHDAGDEVLQAVGATLRRTTRGDDIAGRWGGEEFVVLLTAADLDGARVAAERVRRAVAAINLAKLRGRQLTASVGLTLLGGSDKSTLLASADTAMYAAKDRGRDRVEVAAPTAPAKPERREPAPAGVSWPARSR